MTRDQILIVLIAAGWSGALVLLGLALAWAVRRQSFRSIIALVAAVAVGAVLAGMVGTARAMFLSTHDLGVVVLVALVAGLVSVLGAVAVGSALARWSGVLRDEVQRVGEEPVASGGFAGPAELRSLSEELARTSERLREARERADRIEGSRRELVAWVSHDLRTPLAGLRAMTEALEDGIAEDPGRYHEQIKVEVDRMVQMVDDLFELSRIQAGSLGLSPQPIMVSDLVSDALASAEPVARRAGVRLQGAAPESAEISADPKELSRALRNLVMNAIRHTPSEGVVSVRGHAVGDVVQLAVSDACGGLSDDERTKVFEVAWRGSSARTPEADAVFGSGAGLGLAIVRGIVEAHQGSVDVTNRDPGCEFVVTLPRLES